MAIGWLTILQSVPWSDVISNAPKVADGAKKLWKTVARKSATQATPGIDAQATLSPEARAFAALENRLAALEATTTELHGQMLASSELITVLAEQNAQLIKRIEANRVRVLWLGVAIVGLVVMTVVAAVKYMV
jgi:hypothetical protein